MKVPMMMNRWLRPYGVWGVAISILWLAGCQSPEKRAAVAAKTAEQRVKETSERIQQDPVAYLRDVLKRCEALSAYRLMFIRQERLGLIPVLNKPERIAVRFREKPFSVKFDFPDETSDYIESVYVAGANNDKLIVRERRGMLGLPPTIRIVNPMDAVIFGRSKRPITDFGLTKMVGRTLTTIDKPPKGEPAKISYEGIVTLEQTGVTAHHLVILRATTLESPCPKQDLWIDVATDLPAGTRLVLPNDATDGLYLYYDVKADTSLSDADFQVKMPTSKPGK